MSNHKTKGIVLKTVPYGETSIITGIYTELFGMQSYIVNGVRVSSKRGPGKGNMLQPGAILDMEVYHNDLKNLQRIRDFRWAYIYSTIFRNVFRNAVALYMVELLQKSIKQPESNPELFHFIEDAFIHLDQAGDTEAANFPLYFALHLGNFFGFRVTDTYSPAKPVLDLREGEFIEAIPEHPYFLEGRHSMVISELLKIMQPSELTQLRLGRDLRRLLLHAIGTFYALHVTDFGTMRTLPVLEAVLD